METLEPGAVLVLYSDGLIERRREPLTTGLDRLERAAVALRHAPVTAICDSLFTALGVAEQRSDDVVVLGLRAAPPAEEPFHEVLTADKRALAGLRGSLRAGRRAIGAPALGEAELLLAVDEACANAIGMPTRAVRPAPARSSCGAAVKVDDVSVRCDH